jgi:5'-nucleotidase
MARIILTNDDGIGAPGIAALHRACERFGERIVVAPSTQCSGVGHAVTTHGPIPVKVSANDWFAVGGTPADCTRLALTRIAPDAEWIVSGINRGGNLGVDVYVSGTVAAAREAAILGRRAVAVSQYVRPDLEIDWLWSAEQAAAALRLLADRPPEPGVFYNVNLPHLPPGSPAPEIVFCELDPEPLDVRYRLESVDGELDWVAHYAGVYAHRTRCPGTDVDVCFGGRIAVTRLVHRAREGE